MKLELKVNQKSTVEFSLGEMAQRFEPGRAVEIENEALAEYLLKQPQIKKAGSEIEEVEQPEEAEKNPNMTVEPSTLKGKK